MHYSDIDRSVNLELENNEKIQMKFENLDDSRIVLAKIYDIIDKTEFNYERKIKAKKMTKNKSKPLIDIDLVLDYNPSDLADSYETLKTKM